MDMPDVTPFPEWVSCINIPNMVQLAQNGRWQGAFFQLTMKNLMKNIIISFVVVQKQTHHLLLFDFSKQL